MHLTIYKVSKAYNENEVYYQVLPYSFIGTIKTHFKFYNGFKSLISFLKDCRFGEKSANKLKMKKQLI